MANKVLEVKNLSVGFLSHARKVHIIRDVSIDVIEGETLAIVGESGSGKSVFTKTFTGMLDANGYIEGGSIMFHGQDIKFFLGQRLFVLKTLFLQGGCGLLNVLTTR